MGLLLLNALMVTGDIMTGGRGERKEFVWNLFGQDF